VFENIIWKFGEMMRFFVLSLVLFLIVKVTYSAPEPLPTTTIRGEIVSNQSRTPIIAATVRLTNTKLGAISTDKGTFRIENVPVGRYQLEVFAIGYEKLVRQVVLTSGKELQLSLELNESYVETEEIVVTGAKGSFTPINESAIVSSQMFSVDEVERYAGARFDPARAAQNFAGVLGANDERNDIVVRGGSPTELLWRLDGLDIPNPNHFATQGATGGPISVLNTRLLDNSDFMTGAFPAEYNDKMSGVFDLRTRKGNNENYEFMGQLGFNGVEAGAEGPIPGSGSFIANYRYSFLGILQDMGVDFGTGTGIPEYQDAMIKVDLDKWENDKISLTGLFGSSNIYIKDSEDEEAATNDEDVKDGTDLYSLGINWQHVFNDDMFGRLTLGTVYSVYNTDTDSVTVHDNGSIETTPYYSQSNYEAYVNAKYNLNYSPGNRHYLSSGIEARHRFYKIDEERYTIGWGDTERYQLYKTDNSMQYQGFLNWNWKIDENLTTNIGLASQYLAISDKSTIEPRASLNYQLGDRNSFSLGFGLHRQSLPLQVYYSRPENRNLDFMQSIHYVAGYTFLPFEDALIKIEGYYKDISNAPIEKDSISSWSFLNGGTSFGSIAIDRNLVSKGTGRTYGAELTFMKHFSNGYYITATGSYVRQEYKGSDGVLRNGQFDNRFIFNLLGGYEWVVSPTFSIEFSGKYTLAGGRPYTPIDIETSAERNSTWHYDDLAYTLRMPNYNRLDLRIDFRNNLEGYAIISYVSVENVLNVKNVAGYSWDVNGQKIHTSKQLGIFPIGGVRIEF
jgi:hypothetical protein